MNDDDVKMVRRHLQEYKIKISDESIEFSKTSLQVIDFYLYVSENCDNVFIIFKKSPFVKVIDQSVKDLFFGKKVVDREKLIVGLTFLLENESQIFPMKEIPIPKYSIFGQKAWIYFDIVQETPSILTLKLFLIVPKFSEIGDISTLKEKLDDLSVNYIYREEMEGKIDRFFELKDEFEDVSKILFACEIIPRKFFEYEFVMMDFD